jgi:hypothetical protein
MNDDDDDDDGDGKGTKRESDGLFALLCFC